MKSNLFFLILPTLCCLVYQAHAQCNNVSLALASAPSDCYQSGSITVQVSGTDAANLNLTTAQYSLEAVPNTGTPAPVNWQTWADPTTRTVSGGVLAQVSAGTYRVKMQAFCLANAVPTIIESNSTITVGGNYTEPDAYITANIRKTFVCTERFIGRIPIAVSGGRMHYTITMTSHPAAYTATTTFTRNTAGTEEINNLPAGNYSFTVSDNCGYTIAGLTATITTFAADFIPEMIYPWAYMPLAAEANSDSIRIQTHNI